MRIPQIRFKLFYEDMTESERMEKLNKRKKAKNG